MHVLVLRAWSERAGYDVGSQPPQAVEHPAQFVVGQQARRVQGPGVRH